MQRIHSHSRRIMTASVTLLCVCALVLLISTSSVSAGQFVNKQGVKLQVVSSTVAGYISAGIAATGANGNATGDGNLYDTGRFRTPRHIAYNSKKNLVYITDSVFNNGALKVVDLAKGNIRTVCGQQSSQNLHAGVCGMDGTTGTGIVRFAISNTNFNTYHAYDALRDQLYFIDGINGSIHRVDMSTYDGASSPPTITDVTQGFNITLGCPAPIVPGVAFSMSYQASSTQLCRPSSISVDEKHNVLYIADSNFGGIIQINLTSNIVSSTVIAPIGSILGVNVTKVFYRSGSNSLLIGTPDALTLPLLTTVRFVQLATYNLNTKVVMDYPSVTLPAGQTKAGATGTAMWYYTAGLNDNSVLYHMQTGGQVRNLDFTTNNSIAIAGQYYAQDFGAAEAVADGPANTTTLNNNGVYGLYLDKTTNSLFISDGSWHRISKIDLNTNTSKWIAGGGRTGPGWTDGPMGVGGLRNPYGMEWWSLNNSVIFMDGYSNRARKLTVADNTIISINGGYKNHIDHFDTCSNLGFNKINPDGSGNYMGLATRSVRLDPINPANLMFPVSYCMGYLNSTTNFVINMTITAIPGYVRARFGVLADMAISKDGQNMFYLSPGATLNGVTTSMIIRSRPNIPGSRLNWTDTILCGNATIAGSTTNGNIKDGLCGRDGVNSVGQIGLLQGMIIDDAAKRLYFTDVSVLRYLYPFDSETPSLYTFIGKPSTLYSIDGNAAVANFVNLRFPILGTLSGTPVMFVTDSTMNNIRMIDMSNTSAPIAYTIAGPSGKQSDPVVANTQWIDGVDDQIRFFNPFGIAFNGVDTLFVSDYNNNKIRKLTLSFPTSSSSTAASSSSSTATSSSSTSHSSSSTAVSSSSSTSTTSSTSTSSTGASSSTSTSSTTDSSTAASSSSSTAESSSSSSTVDSSSSAASSSSSSSSGSGSAISGESSSSSTGDSTGTIGASTQLTPHSFSSIIGVILVAALTYFHL